MRFLLNHVACSIFVFLLAACAEPADPGAAGFVARDSAGIRIVESSVPAWGAAEAWKLGDAPSLDIGRLDGPDETQFFRVIAAVRLSDGSIVLGSIGSNDLRRFTPDGEHVWTAGRKGAGPGEFLGLTRLAAGPGDTLLAYDFRLRRVSRFGPDGVFLDSRPLEKPGDGGFVFVEALLPDGRAIYTSRVFGGADGLAPAGEIRRDTIGIHVSGTAGDTAREIDRFPGPEMVVLRSGETGGGYTISVSSPAFGRSTEIAAGGRDVWIGDTDRFEIRRYGLDGRLEALVRRTHDPVLVDDLVIGRAMEEDLANADDDNERRMIQRKWENVPIPATLPAYESLKVDRLGNLWVHLYEVPGQPERIWSVFTRAGEWLGDVSFPGRLRPLEIGDDYVIARYDDVLDVEHIQLWELVKPAG